VISAGYSLVRQYFTTQSQEVSISQIAQDIQGGKISTITVEGDSITATYADNFDSYSVERFEVIGQRTATLAPAVVPSANVTVMVPPPAMT